MIASPVLAPRSRLHLQYLDSLRGLSALYVTACHAYLMYAADFATEGLRSASGPLLVATSWVVFGGAAVALFIVLSGYCLMLPVVQSRRQDWPVTFWPFYVAQGVAHPAAVLRRPGVFSGPHPACLRAGRSIDPRVAQELPALSTGSAVSHLLLVHNYFPDYQYAINHPLWSIATEWPIYFLFPLFLWIGKRHGEFSIVVTAGAITVALNLYLLSFSPQHNSWPPQFVGLFGFGMACAAWCFPARVEGPPSCGAGARASVARRVGRLLVQSVPCARAAAGDVLSSGPTAGFDTVGFPGLDH